MGMQRVITNEEMESKENSISGSDFSVISLNLTPQAFACDFQSCCLGLCSVLCITPGGAIDFLVVVELQP